MQDFCILCYAHASKTSRDTENSKIRGKWTSSVIDFHVST